jgi:hypothetical protein
MKPHRDPSERLLDWARQAPPEPLPQQPHPAFATRVLARLRKPPETPWWEYLALRFALAGCATAAILWLARPAPSLGIEPARLAVSMIEAAVQ